jgi:hypothetical protein
MKPYFLDPIKSEADAEGFFFCLHQDGLLFHPEDDPAIVINDQGQLFDDDEVKALRQRIDEVYEFMDDPCEFILSMTESDFQR